MNLANALAAELLKLRRSAVWVVVLILPLLSVITGTVNYVMNAGVLDSDWDSYWSQVTLFYGLIFGSVGIAVLCSAMWRMEHLGNWPRLMSGPTATWQVVAAKLGGLALLVAAMQAALFFFAWIAGVAFAGMSLAIPGRFAVGAFVAALAGLSVAALHSLVSMLVRSFAAPVAVAVFGCVVAVGLLLSGTSSVLSSLVPYALLTQSLSLGSSAFSDSVALSWAEVAKVAAPSLALALVLTALAAAILDRREIWA
ncbi:MAG: ABC transporter permease [Dermatophilus congolensis]|nr:ABC transporter permease [Dermatophilus congolensis]